jgi:ferrous iron transport protein B
MGNPNVGKSTVFNELTGSHQHTGNWTGKTVELAKGSYYYKYNDYELVDLPGTYSLIPSSREEKVAGDYLLGGKYDCVVMVLDSTALQRNLNLVYQVMEITNKLVVLLNLTDEAKKRNIGIDAEMMSRLLGIPVIKATARSGRGINKLLEEIHIICTSGEDYYLKRGADLEMLDLPFLLEKAEFVCEKCVNALPSKRERRERFLDSVLLGRYTAIPVMLLLFGLVLWLTVAGSNYPSNLLESMFSHFELWLADTMLGAGISEKAVSLIAGGILRVLLWVVAVMLPPMAIFFPLFAVLEDFGILPRFAFNLDRPFEKCGACGKQALTTCMGMGCNAVGVTGCRIIDSPRERAVAIITNSITPCNGRFPLLIAVTGMFLSHNSMLSAVILLGFMSFSAACTFLSSKLLTSTVLKGEASSMIMELPKFRRPHFKRLIYNTVREKILLVLMRAVVVAAPAGLIIWLFANVSVGGISLLAYLSSALEPFGRFMGLDGVILLAFILGFPANEIVIPIILMCYLSTGELGSFESLDALREILVANGWSIKTAICVCVFSILHFPCSTTLLTIWRETKSLKRCALSVATPLLFGVSVCSLINFIF